MKLLVATSNRGKLAEIRALTKASGLEVVGLGDLADTLGRVEIVEDAETFAGNARKKAQTLHRLTGLPTLADDSGLVVEALGGEPGVRSARFSGAGATAATNNARLVERLRALDVEDPAAAFVCHAVVVAPDGRVVAEAEGRVEGIIRWPARGEGGFGYDPLFHHPPSGCRLSELDPAAKNAISHRGRALRALAAKLAELGSL